uniref:Uncharacterized protein n=1 Tax=Oncorhynchus tshawytscha TaxID=74940 RepID=A0A8C8IQ03_ONCTS
FLKDFVNDYLVNRTIEYFINMANSLEILAHRTAESLELITAEMVAIRIVAMHNRFALDYFLSAYRGTCAVIGAEYCTYSSDKSNLIQKIRTEAIQSWV